MYIVYIYPTECNC